MLNRAKKILCLIFVFSFSLPLYAGQTPAVQETEQKAKEAKKIIFPRKLPPQVRSFWDFINRKAYAFTINTEKEEEKLRGEWQSVLGLDIFYPYYMAKEIEDWVKDKGSLAIFQLRGRPEFSKNQVRYIFKLRF